MSRCISCNQIMSAIELAKTRTLEGPEGPVTTYEDMCDKCIGLSVVNNTNEDEEGLYSDIGGTLTQDQIEDETRQFSENINLD